MRWEQFKYYIDRKKGITWDEFCALENEPKSTVKGGYSPSASLGGGFVVHLINKHGEEVKVGFCQEESGAKSMLRYKQREQQTKGNQL